MFGKYFENVCAAGAASLETVLTMVRPYAKLILAMMKAET